MTYSDEAADVWLDRLRGVGTGKNNKYFFTEKGWKEVGRHVVTKLLQVNQKFRIIKVKHNEVEIMATDNDLEVAVRWRKPKNEARKDSFDRQ